MNKSVFRIHLLPKTGSGTLNRKYIGMCTPNSVNAFAQTHLINDRCERDQATVAKWCPYLFRDGDRLVNGILWSTSHRFHIFRWEAAGHTGALVHEEYQCDNDVVWYPN